MVSGELCLIVTGPASSLQNVLANYSRRIRKDQRNPETPHIFKPKLVSRQGSVFGVDLRNASTPKALTR